MTPLPGGFPIDHRLLASVKALLAVAGFALLVWDWRFGSTPPVGWIRLRTAALATIGVLSLAAWWNFGALHGSGRPLHLHDVFHYYMGSKYYAELEYTRIYQCVAVVEKLHGRSDAVARRWTRNLETNDLERHLPDAAETADCLSRFGPERWNTFSTDVEFFRSHMESSAWAGIPMVFGHNATPVWNAMGHWLVGSGPASDRQIVLLGALDSVLLAIMWLVVWRTFGWQAASVAAIWWGLNEATGYYWVGGGFLRQDALFCIVGGVCALRTGRGALAGAALGTATLLRAFPLFLVVGIGIKFLLTVRQRGLRVAWIAYRGFAAGLALAGVVLLTFTTLTWRGRWEPPLEPWSAFAANSQKHLSTPITNHVGLKPALWFSADSRAARISDYWIDGPWDSWRAARTSTFESRKALYYAIAGIFLIVFVLSVRSLDPWIVLVASAALLPFATTLANYYYSVFLLFGLLWPLDKPIGVGLAGLSALTAALPAVLDQRDDRYVVISVAVVVYAFFVAIRLWRLQPSPVQGLEVAHAVSGSGAAPVRTA